MTTDPQDRLATRAEVYNLASAICMLIALAVMGPAGSGGAPMYVTLCAFGMTLYFGMKARWVTSPDPRRRALAAAADSARDQQLTNDSRASMDDARELIADLQRQVLQLRKKVEGF